MYLDQIWYMAWTLWVPLSKEENYVLSIFYFIEWTAKGGRIVIWNLRRRFTIYLVFLDIKNLISRYQEFISWYQEIQFLISRNEMHFLISRNWFLDINNSISWYQEIDFLILIIRFLDIKKSISWCQEMYSESLFYYLIQLESSLFQKKTL